jgi:hypothetical protein
MPRIVCNDFSRARCVAAPSLFQNFISTGSLGSAVEQPARFGHCCITVNGVARRSNTDVFSLLAPCRRRASAPSVLDSLLCGGPLASTSCGSGHRFCPLHSVQHATPRFTAPVQPKDGLPRQNGSWIPTPGSAAFRPSEIAAPYD